MRKLFFLFAFAGLAVVVFHSCRKDTLQTPTDEKQHVYTAEELNIWRNLSNFNNKIKSGLKSEEFISPDSAMWYLEALYNVTQTTNTTFDDLITFERIYTLNINESGNIDINDVTNVYNQMIADMKYELDLIEEDYKFSVIGDLSETTNRDGDLTLEFKGGIGINPLIYYDPITTDDNWRWGNMKGKCENSQYDSDAGIQLKVRFNNPAMAQDTTREWLEVIYDDADWNSFPNRIFYEYTTSGPPCMEYDEIQYYLTEGHHVLHNTSSDTLEGIRPDNYMFRYMRLWTNSDSASNADNKYWHKYGAFYGIPSHLPPIE